MKYTLIVTADPEKAPPAGSPEQDRYFGAFFAFNQEIEDKGVYLAGEPLQPVETATTVRMSDGKITLTDGPFAETKEQIGGFYLLECARPRRSARVGLPRPRGDLRLRCDRGARLHGLLVSDG